MTSGSLIAKSVDPTTKKKRKIIKNGRVHTHPKNAAVGSKKKPLKMYPKIDTKFERGGTTKPKKRFEGFALL